MNLCGLFVQGEIDRRAFLDAAEEFAALVVSPAPGSREPLPQLRWAEQVPKTESCMTTE
jgi:hypothetical protein